jgi:hypothetical protein
MFHTHTVNKQFIFHELWTLQKKKKCFVDVFRFSISIYQCACLWIHSDHQTNALAISTSCFLSEQDQARIASLEKQLAAAQAGGKEVSKEAK